MTTTATSGFKRIKNVKSAAFDAQKLSSYSLCLLIGIRDFQFCVINKQTSKCLVLEDYRLENIKTINTRLEAIQSIVAQHPLLKTNKWDSIKIAFKSHKFSLVPNTYFVAETASDYLALNSDLKTKIEEVYYYKHISSDAVNVFAADRKVIQWAKQQYPRKSIQVIHQGSSFIEGIISYDDHSHEKSMFALFDSGILHVAVTQNQKLLYYNQFASRKPEDYLKYIMLVFKEVGLSQKSSKLILWGAIKNDSPTISVLRKYIRNISLGAKPNFLKLPDEFNDLPEHRYFDLYSIFLCE